MIPLSCPQCGKKLKVRDELAGKKVRCPQCKQALEIPCPDDATVPPQHRPERREDAPFASTTPRAEDDHPAASGPSEIMKTGGSFEVSGEIARGGMGAIMRAIDQDIHREVAVKVLLDHADSRLKARFVEEAQITGQLEHPNIVPIHQLGVHEDGRCFFSMKMVKGRSLAQILKQGEPGASATGGEYSLGRLLNILVSICNALAYAHSRQVIHRDLKPANIMVGDFGEVYVMDWGLAKVLDKVEPSVPSTPSTHVQRKKSLADSTKPAKPSDSSSGERVTTHRLIEGDLTQAGSLMGTPAYMPPEQAEGKLEDVDERSDIYSLGAILYEMMTLTPPVGRGGDVMSIVVRVIDGKIDLPGKRAPERAKAGWIPPELSAIAMKALAKKRGDRYQTVAELQRDIELYLEGRSVSAKQDSTWEMFKKLVKRNKGVSVATTAALIVLLGSMVFIIMAWQETRREQDARRAQGKKSAPAFLEDARHSAARMKIDHALAQVDVALDFDPDLTDAWLLKGQLLIGQKKFEEARKYLSVYLKRQPGDANAKKLLDLCALPNTDDIPVLLDFSETLTRQKAYVLAEVMLGHMGDRKDFLQRLFKLYQGRLDAAWPGAGANFWLDGNGEMRLTLAPEPIYKLVKDLSPLQGMKLNSLDIHNCRQVADLTPLQGMKLHYLNLGFLGKLTDLSPLQGMPLTNLDLNWCVELTDLAPLTGMPLSLLDLRFCGKVTDLSPLKGMSLKLLSLNASSVSDLAPLADMPLETLDLRDLIKVQDLTPLTGMPLTSLFLPPQVSKGLEIVRNMKSLKTIDNKPAAQFWKEHDAKKTGK